jgi:hypothetical protein
MAPQKFNTFNTFTTFAKFANVNPALDYPALIHRHAPRLGSISERASRSSPPLLSPTGEGGKGGEGSQNRQRVAPYGSAVATPKTVWMVKR